MGLQVAMAEAISPPLVDEAEGERRARACNPVSDGGPSGSVLAAYSSEKGEKLLDVREEDTDEIHYIKHSHCKVLTHYCLLANDLHM